MCGSHKGQMMLCGLLVLCALFEVASCDYTCLCNYLTERDVYSVPSNDSAVVGSMYEFDCKPIVTESGRWFTVAFEHQLGYVENGDRLEKQTCQGGYPDADRITNSSTTTTATLSNSYTIVAIVPSASPPAHTKNTKTTRAPSATTSKTVTERSTTQATQRVTSTASTPTPTSITPSVTSTASTTTQTPTATYIQVTRNVLHECELLTHQSNTAFAYNNSCYELVTQHRFFQVAEDDCVKKGGHLAHIKNDREQQFLTSNVKQHYHGDHYIWIGLHDAAQEEHFVWTSGEPVSYTHWFSGRKNFFLHGVEDCVAFKLVDFFHGNDGTWDDLPCNIAHAYICQYDLQPVPHIVG